MEKELFLSKLPDSLIEYTKEKIYEHWQKFKPYADSRFESKLDIEFESTLFEILLGSKLVDSGLELSSKDKGPDFKIEFEGKTIWMEAVCPDVGTKVDRVPKQIPGDYERIPDEQIILRLRAAIFDKYKKYLDYITKETVPVKKEESCIIAIADFKIEQLQDFDGWDEGMLHTPYILQSLFSIGMPAIRYNENGESNLINSYRDNIQKKNKDKKRIDTNIFRNNSHSLISGILYCRTVDGSKLDKEYIWIPNPYADIQVPENIFIFAKTAIVDLENKVINIKPDKA